VGGYLEVRLGDDAVDAPQLLVDLLARTGRGEEHEDEEMLSQ
jgi:hypothetical protein